MVVNPSAYRWSSAASHVMAPESGQAPLIDWEFRRTTAAQHRGTKCWGRKMEKGGFQNCERRPIEGSLTAARKLSAGRRRSSGEIG